MTPDDPAGDDATRLTPPSAPDDDSTRLTPAPGDDGATALAPPSDPDATQLTPTPVSGTVKRRPRSGESGPLTIGDRFGRYTIVRLLGMGGMGAVYQAWDQELEVVVALKVIRPDALQDPTALQEIERRFKRELLLARQVTHKNVVRIHDLGEIDGIKYITMTYVDGRDLATIVAAEGGKLEIPRVMRVMTAVVSGLVAAHKAGVVHRDLKPANIMIDADGEALIMDFGIARSSGGPAGAPVASPGAISQISPSGTGSGRTSDATVLGAIVGTLEYMSPEQARGEPVDHRSDLYTTGLILYDLLSGRKRALHAGSAVEKLKARVEGGLPPLKSVAPEVPDALAAVVTRAIEVEPGKRYQTTEELADALAALDERGVPKPVKRTVGLKLAAVGLVAAVGISFGAWFFFFKQPPPPVARDPVQVVIADFENRTGDPSFDRTLEPMMRRALEGAGFIIAFDRNGLRRTVGLQEKDLPAKLDEAAAREIAIKQGLGVVLVGAVEKQGNRFSVSMKVIRAVTGEVVTDVRARANAPDQVIPTATTLVSSVREALGDTTAESDPIFAQASLSAKSLEVVRYYAAAMDATANARYEDARAALTKAVEIDSKFGAGYLVLAGISRNTGRVEDAKQYIKQALSNLEGMTEREQMTTRGMYYRLEGDYKQCVSEHKLLIERFKADVVGGNQLALCASYLRDWDTAVTTMQGLVKILPNRTIFRNNLAFYSNYSGDFAAGEQEASTVMKAAPNDFYAPHALGMSLSAQDRMGEAAEAYRKLATLGGLGPTFSASGLGDVAIYEGRFAEAVKILEDGAAADLAAKVPERAAWKFAAQAYAHLQRGNKAAAVASATKALSHSQSVKTRFLASRIFVEAGQPAKAQPHLTSLSAEVQPEPQAYAKIIEALIAINSADARPAIKLITEANELFPTWIGHFDLGRAYLATRQYPQADSAFSLCIKRRGEALSLLMDEDPTFGYFPPVQYYLGRTREGLGTGGAGPYKAYLAMREKAGEDPRLAEVRKKIK